MAHWRAIHAAVPAPVHDPESAGTRDLLYKTDYPRTIDRHIDFFGQGTLLTDADSDHYGDLLLESLA